MAQLGILAWTGGRVGGAHLAIPPWVDQGRTRIGRLSAAGNSRSLVQSGPVTMLATVMPIVLTQMWNVVCVVAPLA
ncbi:hypothetical protein F4808DRAFT_445913 [Astrocystis sublimbata]|nr:hypothetical protein F4808DRAFT_445913 [Astrocystis sublimbata]